MMTLHDWYSTIRRRITSYFGRGPPVNPEDPTEPSDEAPSQVEPAQDARDTAGPLERSVINASVAASVTPTGSNPPPRIETSIEGFIWEVNPSGSYSAPIAPLLRGIEEQSDEQAPPAAFPDPAELKKKYGVD